MNKKTIIGITIALVSVSVVILYVETQQPASKPESIVTNQTPPKTPAPTPSPTSEKSTQGEVHGEYKDYTSATIKAETEKGNRVVLFFHAAWCPECRAADAAFKAKPEEIPAHTVVLKTDYDSNKELKKKYVVTYQHTFVQVDDEGNQITKWVGGNTENLKKYLK